MPARITALCAIADVHSNFAIAVESSMRLRSGVVRLGQFHVDGVNRFKLGGVRTYELHSGNQAVEI